ncbi:MAG: hypothetical protein IPQ07_30640 [Myxococcales bacterium]|nr:hypothetical protein [Myxococcales bacterium]
MRGSPRWRRRSPTSTAAARWSPTSPPPCASACSAATATARSPTTAGAAIFAAGCAWSPCGRRCRSCAPASARRRSAPTWPSASTTAARTSSPTSGARTGEAFDRALATLTPRERNLLKQQYVYGATIDELGALYGVHRATAARWLAQIRDTLMHRTRGHIAEAMRLTGTDLESAMGKLAEHVEFSLRHTLSRE